jgi:putative hydrolase of the HAD superfamily
MAIRALLCDVDGVIRHWPNMAGLEQEQGLPAGAVAAVAFEERLLIRAITGELTDEQWRSAVEAALGARYGQKAAQGAVAAWSAMRPRLDAEVVELLREVRRSMPVALVSNATTRLEKDLADQGIADIADVVANTSRLGFAKPDTRVFYAAARAVGVEPAQCLFVDDTVGHVEAARSIGMPALHFGNVGALRAALG